MIFDAIFIFYLSLFLVLLGRLSEVNYSPMDLKFCFYIGNFEFFVFFRVWDGKKKKHFHEKLTLRKTLRAAQFLFCFARSSVCSALGRKSLAEKRALLVQDLIIGVGTAVK